MTINRLLKLLLMTSIFISCCLAFIFNGLYILLLANIVFVVFILIRSKISWFSLKTILANYVLIPILFQYYTGFSYGILESSKIPIHLNLLLFIVSIYNYITAIYVSNSSLFNYENKKYFNLMKLKPYMYRLFCALALLFIFVYYPPSFLRFGNTERFYHLLPGDFWNHLALVLLLLCLPNLKKSIFVKFSYLLFVVWCAVRGERVDVLGLLIITVVYLLKTKTISLKSFFILLISLMIIMVFIGTYRVGDRFSSLYDILKDVVIQKTSADIGYIYNISIQYVQNYSYLFGKSYINYLYELIPGTTQIYDVSNILMDIYGHPGGIFVLSEPYMNFGIFGVFIYSILENQLMCIIIKSKSKISTIYYLFYIMTSFRYIWYGVRYVETATIYLIPCLYLLVKYLNNSFNFNMNNLNIVNYSGFEENVVPKSD